MSNSQIAQPRSHSNILLPGALQQDEIKNESKDYFSAISSDPLEVIFSFSEPPDIASLSQTNHFFHTETKPLMSVVQLLDKVGAVIRQGLASNEVLEKIFYDTSSRFRNNAKQYAEYLCGLAKLVSKLPDAGLRTNVFNWLIGKYQDIPRNQHSQRTRFLEALAFEIKWLSPEEKEAAFCALFKAAGALSDSTARAIVLSALASEIKWLPAANQVSAVRRVLNAVSTLKPEHRATVLAAAIPQIRCLAEEQRDGAFFALLAAVRELQDQKDQKQGVDLLKALAFQLRWLSKDQGNNAFYRLVVALPGGAKSPDYEPFSDEIIRLRVAPGPGPWPQVEDLAEDFLDDA